jgi:hypothetical protein
VEPHRDGVPDELNDVGRAWLRRPFARTFDRISAAYGWTDDQILDLPFGRVRQVHDVIVEREGEQQHLDLMIRSVELRTLCQYVAAAGGGQKLLDTARAVSLLPDEERPKPAVREIPFATAMRMFGGPP